MLDSRITLSGGPVVGDHLMTPTWPNKTKRKERKMENKNAINFIKAVTADRDLAEKISILAAENGYDFTAEELLEFGDIAPISDEQAGNTTGGFFIFGHKK